MDDSDTERKRLVVHALFVPSCRLASPPRDQHLARCNTKSGPKGLTEWKYLRPWVLGRDIVQSGGTASKLLKNCYFKIPQILAVNVSASIRTPNSSPKHGFNRVRLRTEFLLKFWCPSVSTCNNWSIAGGIGMTLLRNFTKICRGVFRFLLKWDNTNRQH